MYLIDNRKITFPKLEILHQILVDTTKTLHANI